MATRLLLSPFFYLFILIPVLSIYASYKLSFASHCRLSGGNGRDIKKRMKLIDYWARLFQAFLTYKRKKTRLSHPPVRLWIEPTSVCNLRCVMCPNKDLKREEKGFMELDLYEKIIEQASSFAFDIHLYHRGESLLHPRFVEMVRMAKETGLHIKLHTNATILDDTVSRGLIEAGLDQLTFSFDGFDAVTYEKIRVNGRFEKTVGNIIGFLQVKKALAAKNPLTILELIAFPDLHQDDQTEAKKSFLDRFRDLPLDRLEIRELHNWAGETGEAVPSNHYSPCTFLWLALIILWDGTVLPCTQDFHGYYPLGNVRDNSLLELWNSPAQIRLREKMIRRDIADLETCSRCDRPWRQTFFGIPRENLWKFLFRRMS